MRPRGTPTLQGGEEVSRKDRKFLLSGWVEQKPFLVLQFRGVEYVLTGLLWLKNNLPPFSESTGSLSGIGERKEDKDIICFFYHNIHLYLKLS